MPLTHDIGVRIPYPLLKTDNFGCLFFCFMLGLIVYRAGDVSPDAFRLYVLASKRAYNSLKPQTFGFSSAYHTRQNIL